MQPVTPPTPHTPRTRGRPPKYSTPEEWAQARLIQSRQNLQRYRERQKAKTASSLSAANGSSSQQLTKQEDNINDDQESRSVILFPENSPEFPSESSESDSSSRNISSNPACTINFERLKIYQPAQSPISPIKTLRLPAGNYPISLLYYLS